MRYRVMLLGLAVPALLLLIAFVQPGSNAQEKPPQNQSQSDQQPVFRAGVNFVRVDVIVTDKKGEPVNDLTDKDFQVFEDDKPQKIESFELIQARTPNPQTERIEATNVRDMNQQAANAR